MTGSRPTTRGATGAGAWRPTAMVVRTAGTNCDAEMVRAFRLAGAEPRLVHLDALMRAPALLDEADLIGLPGGFSYGDDVASGRLMAARLRERVWPALRAAALRGAPMIGACNGFQVLVQVGLLPGPDGPLPERAPAPTVSLAVNAGGRFIDRWVHVEPGPADCLWTRGLRAMHHPVACALPIAHGEGRLVAPGADAVARLEAAGRVALRYRDNINGSAGAIAGLCDATGRIFGLMPHPERFLEWTRYPAWTRLDAGDRAGVTPGLAVFRSAVEAVVGERATR